MKNAKAGTPVRVAADTRDVLGESPWWDHASSHLYWIDLRAPALHRLDQISGAVESWPMPSQIGAVVGRAGGGVIVLLADGVHAFDPRTGTLSLIAAAPWRGPQMRANDAKCDASGRLWFGGMRDHGADCSGALYLLAAGEKPQRMRSGVQVPNAITMSRTGDTIYFADTRRGAIEQADMAALAAEGEKALWSTLAAAEIAPGVPDGATLDAEGCLWNARYGGSAIARIAPDGRLDRLVELPVTQPTSCAFGGPDLDILYVTTARQRLDAAQLRAQPLAGALLMLDVGVRGCREPAFAG
jgi:sugar lactone lactonase YvrE